MITCTTSITILRKERTFSRFEKSKLKFLQKTASLLENEFLCTISQLTISLKNLGKLRDYFLAWTETLDEK